MMADLCMQCSIEIWGEDSGDFAKYLGPSHPPIFVICEGCGPTIVDAEGRCIDPQCPTHGTLKSESTRT